MSYNKPKLDDLSTTVGTIPLTT